MTGTEYILCGAVQYLEMDYGFLTPVFRHENELYAQQSDDDATISSFKILPSHYHNAVLPISESRAKIEGDECLFCFKYGEEIRYDDPISLSKYLLTSVVANIEDSLDKNYINRFIEKHVVDDSLNLPSLIWKDCLALIKQEIAEQSFKTWFEPLIASKLISNVLTIQVPSLFFYEWLEEHYVSLLRKVIKHKLGDEGRLEYNVVMEYSSSKIPFVTTIPANQDGYESKLRQFPIISKGTNFFSQGLKKINVDPQLNRNYTFDNYIEGNCNRLARSAGVAIANKPGGTSFNPLVIYGNVGLGKTHLAHAIGNRIRQTYADLLVLYVTCEKFTQQFVDALKHNNINDFVNFYQAVDVLIMDDVHDFAGKEKTQDFFFHIFNHLHQAGKQLIITTDKSPKDIEGMEERLLSRFKWGLTVDLQIPDLETRMAILKNKIYQDGIEIPDDVIEYVAFNIDKNVRELEGAMVSLLAQSTLNRKEIDLTLAKQMLKNSVKNSSREISMEYIQNLVSEYFEVPISMVKSQTRKREIVQARQISMYLAKAHTKSSLKSIGHFFGGRDNSTVIYACRTVEELLDSDEIFKANLIAIEDKISHVLSAGTDDNS